MLVASAVMIHAFITGDFHIKYVQHYSNAAQPFFYKLASYWGGLDGSIMFWVHAVVDLRQRGGLRQSQRHRLLMPWVVATISVVEMFFLFLMVIHNNPFDTFLSAPPTQGEGLNPLLQNYYMAIHPPMLYLGFVGMTIPFAFGIAALASGQLDDSWLRAVRRWTMMAWLFLSIGLTLGALWAYEELGWGGYWGWDPVENAGLLPWFTATAFLHSVMVQERRGMLKVWNVVARHRDVLPDDFRHLHDAFGRGAVRARVRRGPRAGVDVHRLHGATLVVSFALVIYRLPLTARAQRARFVGVEGSRVPCQQLGAAVRRVLRAVRDDVPDAERGRDRPAAHRRPSRSSTSGWRRSASSCCSSQGWDPCSPGGSRRWRICASSSCGRPSTAVAVEVGVLAMGFRFWPAGLYFGLCAFVAGTIGQEFLRGAFVRREATGTDLFTALVGLFARSRRRYGGYVVHLGIVLIFLGFAGKGSTGREGEGLARAASAGRCRPYVRSLHMRSAVTQDTRKQMVTAEVDVHARRQAVGSMYPARWFFLGHEQEPTTEVALRRGLGEDLYVMLIEYDVATQSARLAHPHQSPGELGVAGRRDHGDRDVHRAAAGAGVRLRDEPRARRRGHDVARAAAGVRTEQRAAQGPTCGHRRSHPSRSASCRARRSKRSCRTRSSACAADAAASASASAWRAARRRRCAPNSRSAGRTRQDAGRDRPVLREGIRRPAGAGDADRPGLQPPGLAVARTSRAWPASALVAGMAFAVVASDAPTRQRPRPLGPRRGCPRGSSR